MAVDNYVELRTDSITELIEFMEKELYSSCHNNIYIEHSAHRGIVYRFENNHILAKAFSMLKVDKDFNKSEYGVDVNCAIILRSYPETEVNSEMNVLFLIQAIVKHFKGDFLYLPNGDEPIVIKHQGTVIVKNEFDNYFGEGMKKKFQRRLVSAGIK